MKENCFAETLHEILTKLASTIEMNTFARMGNENNMVGLTAGKKMLEAIANAEKDILSKLEEGRQ